MYKVVFIDLDGTLLRADHSISEETREVIQQLRATDVLIVLVSARPYHGIVAIHSWLGIGDMPVASLNGSYITSIEEVLFSATIPAQRVTRIQELASQYNVTVLYYSGLQWFSEVSNAAVAKEQLITPVQVTTEPYDQLVKRWTAEGMQMNKLMAIGNESDVQGLQQRIRMEFKGSLTAYTSKPTYLEIMPENASKAKAAAFILGMYQIPQPLSIALGDNFNDMEMLSFAGKGIAMGNAPDEIKAVADDITETNQNDGVRKALEKWFEMAVPGV